MMQMRIKNVALAPPAGAFLILQGAIAWNSAQTKNVGPQHFIQNMIQIMIKCDILSQNNKQVWAYFYSKYTLKWHVLL